MLMGFRLSSVRHMQGPVRQSNCHGAEKWEIGSGWLGSWPWKVRGMRILVALVGKLDDIHIDRVLACPPRKRMPHTAPRLPSALCLIPSALCLASWLHPFSPVLASPAGLGILASWHAPLRKRARIAASSTMPRRFALASSSPSPLCLGVCFFAPARRCLFSS